MFKRLLVALALIYAAFPAFAATTPNSPVTPQTPNRGIVQFLQGTDSAGTYKTLYTAGSNGSICKGIWSNNNDASQTHVLTLQIVNGGVKYGGITLLSIVSAGFVTAVPAQDLFNRTIWPGLPVDADGNPYLVLISGDTLQATFATAITSTDLINLVAQCSDY